MTSARTRTLITFFSFSRSSSLCMDYGALCERTDAATARFHELSGRIKAAEARMSEIAALKTQIINYSKTREAYAAYRKAGYSKKFLAEHEREILLHKAAKKAL